MLLVLVLSVYKNQNGTVSIQISISLSGDFDLMSSIIDTEIQKVRGGGGLERPQLQNARYPMGTQYTQNSLCHIQIFLCCNGFIPVLEVLLLRQYQLLDGTVWFCILLLFYKVLDWMGPQNEGGAQWGVQ